MLLCRRHLLFVALLGLGALPTSGQENGAAALGNSPEDPPTSQATAAPDTTSGPQSDAKVAQRYGASIDPLPESRSLFLAGMYLSQGVEANTGQNSLIYGTTRVLGNLGLLKVGRHSETAVDYRAGLADAVDTASSHQFLQQMQFSERRFWQKTALTFSDSLGDYPGASFGSTWFGGASAYNLGSSSVAASLPVDAGIAQFAGSNSLGSGPRRLNNVALAEATDALTRRSEITLAGSYGLDEYFGNAPGYINSRQFALLASYGHQLSARTQIGALYGYKDVTFPQAGAGTLGTQETQFTFTRSVSHRCVFQAGVGPEFTRITTPLTLFGATFHVVTNQTNVSAFSVLGYRTKNATLSASYDRSVTSGSGLFAGANSDLVQVAVGRRILRAWEASVDIGYTRLSRIQQSLSVIAGNSYQFGFAGAAIGRQLGRFRILASYQFNDESVDSSLCKNSKACGLSQRNVALVGIAWHTRPIHLDHGSGQPQPGTTSDDSLSNGDLNVSHPDN